MIERPVGDSGGAVGSVEREDLDIDAWLERLTAHLLPDMVVEATPAERAALLDLARVAARRAGRTAAPVTTYLAGLAFAGLARTERLTRIRELVAGLDREP